MAQLEESGERKDLSLIHISTLAEKCEAGEIIYDLKIKENHAADEYKAGLTLTAGSEMLHAETFLPNFRQGDAIILYERNCDCLLYTSTSISTRVKRVYYQD